MPAEDHVGGGGGELAALVGVPGLDHHRVALRRAGQREGALDVELRSLVADRAGARGVPELPGQLHEFGGPGVAVGAVEVTAAAEVLAGEGVRGGDHVPGGAAAGEMVQRGEAAGQFVRLVEGGVDGRGQPQVGGDGGERAQHGDRLGPAQHVQVVDPALDLAQPQALGEEEEVEPAALGGGGEVAEGLEGDLAAGGRIGPHRGVVDAGEVRGEVDLLERTVRHRVTSAVAAGRVGVPAGVPAADVSVADVPVRGGSVAGGSVAAVPVPDA